jgi:PAS domain S-box-containing protein
MGEEIERFDWDSVGMPLDAWPTPLRHAVGIVLRAPVPMVILWGPDWRLIYNEPYVEILGAKHPAAMGHPFVEVWPQISPAGRDILNEAFRGRPSRHEDALIRLEQGGRITDRWFTLWQIPIVGADGCVGGILSGCIDVTDRVLHQRALGEREAHLTLALAAGQIAPWVVDYRTKQVSSSPELNRMLGFPDEAEPTLEELTAGYYPGELQRLQAAFADALASGDRHFEIEYRHIRRTDGAVRWLLLRACIELSGGEPVRTVGVVMDITSQKENEGRLRLLAREVDHRANNLLTIVQGLVQLDRAQDVAAFRSSLMGRIAALGHAHKLLSESRWTGASLKRLMAEELEPYYGGSRIRIAPASEDVLLSPAVAQSLAMALHELATNASKYGGLSTANGAVEISYIRAGANRMKLVWAETGGPTVKPPSRSGLGLTVIRRAMEGDTGGRAHLEWLPGGLRCELEFPARGRCEQGISAGHWSGRGESNP